MISTTRDAKGDLWADTDAHGEGRRNQWARRRRGRAIAYIVAPGRAATEESPLKRLKSCGRAKKPDVVLRVHNGTAHATGLMACGNIWTCATCSARIRARRETEMQRALAQHCANGGQLGMMTLTLRHHKGDSLTQSIEKLNDSWARIQRYHRYKKLHSLLSGSIATLEITLGDNGWHPHLHIILLARPDVTHDDVRDATDVLRSGWSNLVNRLTDRYSISHGLNLIWFGRDSAAAAKYATKIAKEMTLTSSKKGNDPLALLDRDDDQATALFIEYAYATYRRQCHRWSNGLKAALNTEELTDDEINEDNETVGVEVLTISRELWNSINDTERIAWLEFAETQHRYASP